MYTHPPAFRLQPYNFSIYSDTMVHVWWEN